jgi:hypothetical protein
MKKKTTLSRREFLKFSALALGGLAFSNGKTGQIFSTQSKFPQKQDAVSDFPIESPLGRICVGEPGSRV